MAIAHLRIQPHPAMQKGVVFGPSAAALGGFSTTIHLRAENNGKPINWTLTPGQRHAVSQVPALLEQGVAPRVRERARLRPTRIAGHKGYTRSRIRR